MVGEIEKRRPRAPLLALKQQGHEWGQQRQRGNRLQLRQTQQHAEPRALGSIADLIVILGAYHELIRGDARRGPPMPPLAMRRILPLIHVPVAQRRRYVLEALEIRVVTV